MHRAVAPIVACVALSTLAWGPSSSQEPAGEPEPDGREILERAVRAHGGLDTFRSIRGWRIVARRRGPEIPDGEVYEEYYRNAGVVQTLLIKRRPDGVLTYLHDGRDGYTLVDGRLRDEEGAADEAYYRAHGEYYLRALPFKWMDPGMTATLVGETVVRDHAAWRVEIQAREGVGAAWRDTWTAVIDGASHLLLEARLEHRSTRPGRQRTEAEGATRITYRFRDHRRVDGLTIPFVMEYLSGGEKTGENVIREIRIDPGLDPSLFRVETHLRERVETHLREGPSVDG